MLPSSHIARPPGVLWQKPLCGVYLLLSINSGMLEITRGTKKIVIHVKGKSHSFYNIMVSTQIFFVHVYQDMLYMLFYELISKS